MKKLFFDFIDFCKFINFFEFFPPDIWRSDRDFFNMLGSFIMYPIVIYISVVFAGSVGKKQNRVMDSEAPGSKNIEPILKNNTASRKPILIYTILIGITFLIFSTLFFIQFNKTSAKGNDSVSRFIKNTDDTVLDIKTNLMWAAKDNGVSIKWHAAKDYCENYRGGGYTDWRMPTQDELAGLFDRRKSRPLACLKKQNIHVATELIDITGLYFWASETNETDNAAQFDFGYGKRRWSHMGFDPLHDRALPVRSVK